MNINEYKQLLDNPKLKKLILSLQESSSNARKLSPENFVFFETTIQYLVTMISASVGKFAVLGGEIAEDAFNVQFIGRALDEDIFFQESCYFGQTSLITQLMNWRLISALFLLTKKDRKIIMSKCEMLGLRPPPFIF